MWSSDTEIVTTYFFKMKPQLSIVLYLTTLLGSSNCYPDCIQPDLTCPLNVSNLALPPISRVSWEKCRDMCNKHTYCTSFTFYGPEGTPFRNMCFLFKEDCERSEMVECQCGSGFQCDFCSIRGIFSVNATNLALFQREWSPSLLTNFIKQRKQK